MSLRGAGMALMVAGALTSAAPVNAQPIERPATQHVRGTTVEAALLIDESLARSATVRDLVDRLEHSDLLVYVRYEWFTSSSLRGRIGFLAAGRGQRLFAIEIDCRHNRPDQIAALGHELQHAVEIADVPSVRDARAMAALYAAIGELTGYSSNGDTYETAAAAETGRRVRGELTAPVSQAADTVYPPD
jgi:hypothetical protein